MLHPSVCMCSRFLPNFLHYCLAAFNRRLQSVFPRSASWYFKFYKNYILKKLHSIQDGKSLHDVKRYVVLMVLLPHKLAHLPRSYRWIEEITVGTSPNNKILTVKFVKTCQLIPKLRHTQHTCLLCKKTSGLRHCAVYSVYQLAYVPSHTANFHNIFSDNNIPTYTYKFCFPYFGLIIKNDKSLNMG